ncbi:MAG: SNF2-related protein [Kiritimatiellia bacterium]
MFAPGQRWISESEPELGMGCVVEVSPRRVKLRFPSAEGGTREYAVPGAPLARVRFKPGDTVGGPAGAPRFKIEEVVEARGLITYRGGGVELPESDLAGSLSFDQPELRLLSGRPGPNALFELRLDTLRQRRAQAASPVRGFMGGRMELIPHQLYIAHEVCRRPHPRVLLADEVGLGKTIEACLIVHRMLVTGKAARVLILVPEPLVNQWFVELFRRFNLSFRIYDEERCAAIDAGEGAPNPFLDEQLVLCSIAVACEPVRAAQMIEAGWDVLVVDEAHHLAWSPDRASPEYRVVEQLARVSPSVLLLTATPEQAGQESHFARLRLLDPRRHASFEQFRTDQTAAVALARQAEKAIAAGDDAALTRLMEQHGPGRVMFRNTRSALSGFPRRIPHLWPLQPSDGLVEALALQARWLAEFLQDHPGTKVLVICHTRREVLRLAKALADFVHVKTALFHEDLTLLQRDRQAAWFAEPDGARVLIASEIGGEGRNFQFVQHLVLIHLPEDPELVEQRIGRLDRIGQRGDIHIHLPHLAGSEQAGLIRWLHEGVDVFSAPAVGGREAWLRFEEDLHPLGPRTVADTRRFLQKLRREIEQGRDRLLELNSFRPAVAQAVVERIRAETGARKLEPFLVRLFDEFGVQLDPLDAKDYHLHPGPAMQERFPLREEGLRLTFDRARALEREDITLVTWDHPLVQAGMDLALGGEAGNCACCRMSGRKGLLLQAVFVIECIAPPALQVDRFLPPTPVLLAVDHTSAPVDHTSAPVEVPAGLVLHDADPWTVLENEMLRTEWIPAMLEALRALAAKQSVALVREARKAMTSALGAELQHLISLREINDHIRPGEIEALRSDIARVGEELGNARIRLDAVRLLVGG